MRAFKVIRDPDVFELLADETRRKMIYLLRAKELSVSQIADQLGKTPQAIYHHIRKLVEAGLIEVSKEERIGHFIEAYYRATAEVFEFSHGEGGSQTDEARAKEGLRALARVGLAVDIDDEAASQIVKLVRRAETMGANPELEEKIAQLEDLNLPTKLEVAQFAKYLSMSDKQFDELLTTMREFRTIMKSKLAKPAQIAPKPRTSKS